MAKLAMLVRGGRLEAAFEYCAITLVIAFVSVTGTHGFGSHVGIVLNNVSKLAE